MGFLSKLRKNIVDDFSAGADLLSKAADGGYDILKGIADRTSDSAGYALRGGSKALDALSWSSDLGTGAASKVFGDLEYDDRTGKLGRRFTPESFGRGLARTATLGTGLFGAESRSSLDARENALRRRYGSQEQNNSLSEFGLNQINNITGESENWQNSNLPTWGKVAGGLALDPALSIGVGSLGKIGTKVGTKAPWLAKTLLGTEEAGATSRTARIAGGLIEGVGPKRVIPSALGAGFGAQALDELGVPGGDQIGSFAGFALGHKLGGKSAEEALKNNIISDSNGQVFRDLTTHLQDKQLPNQAKAGAWRGLLNKNQVTNNEMKWNGLDELLSGDGNKVVTKHDILNKIKENDFDIEESILGKNPNLPKPTIDENSQTIKLSDGKEIKYTKEIDEYGNTVYRYNDPNGRRSITDAYSIQDLANDAEVAHSTTQRPYPEDTSIYSYYTVPGGQNYREILIKQKDKSNPIPLDPNGWDIEDSPKFHVGYDDFGRKQEFAYIGYHIDSDLRIFQDKQGYFYLNRMGQNLPTPYKSLQEAMDDARSKPLPLTEDNQWTDHPNVLMHLRVDDRDNGRTLFVHEIQSDWAQENRSGNQTHITHINPPNKNLVIPKNKWQDIPDVFSKDRNNLSSSEVVSIVKTQNGTMQILWNPDLSVYRKKPFSIYFKPDNTERDWASGGNIGEYFNTLEEAKTYAESGNINNTFARWDHPFQDNWQVVGIKRLLRYATENGYDEVKFASGEQTLNIPGMELNYGSREEAGRLNSYNKSIPDIINGLSKKLGFSVTKEVAGDSKSRIAHFAGSPIDGEEMFNILEKNGEIEWRGGKGYVPITEDAKYFMDEIDQYFRDGGDENSLSFLNYLSEAGLKTLAETLANKFGAQITYAPKDGYNTVVHLTPETRNVINSKPQTMFGVVGDNAGNKDFEDQMRFWRQKTMSQDPQEAQQAEEMLQRLSEDQSKRMAASGEGSRSSLIGRAGNAIDALENHLRQQSQGPLLGVSNKKVAKAAEEDVNKQAREARIARLQAMGERLQAEEEARTGQLKLTPEEQGTRPQLPEDLQNSIRNYEKEQQGMRLTPEEISGPNKPNLNLPDNIQSGIRDYQDSMRLTPEEIAGTQSGGMRFSTEPSMVQPPPPPNKPPTLGGFDMVPPPRGTPRVAQKPPTGARLNYLSDLPSFDNLVNDVKTFSDYGTRDGFGSSITNPIARAMFVNPITKLWNSFANPSMFMNTPVGKLITSKYRMDGIIEQLVNAQMAPYDRMSQKFGMGGVTGGINPKVIKMDDNGLMDISGKKVHWNDVFSDIGKYDRYLTPEQKQFSDLWIKFMDDTRLLRKMNDLPALPRDINGKLAIPRQVVEIDGVPVQVRPGMMDHAKKRIYESATEAATNGNIKYADPRDTMKMYMYETYRDIADKQFARAIEKVTMSRDVLINPKIASKYNDVAALKEQAENNLKTAVENWNKDQTNKDLAAIVKQATGVLKGVKKDYKKAKFAYDEAFEKVKTKEAARALYLVNEFGQKEAIKTFSVPGAGMRVVTPSDHDLLRNWIGTMGFVPKENLSGFSGALAKSMGSYGRIVRTATSTLDMATPFTHALPLFFTNPGRWAQVVADQAHAAMNPQYYDQLVTKNLKDIQAMAAHGIPVGTNEFMEAAKREGEIVRGFNATLGKVPIAGRVIGEGTKQTFGRLETAMDTVLLATRLQLWKANYEKFAKNNNLDGLAQYVRNMTGALDTRSLMINKSQREWESLWLAFSPKLFRSSVGLIGMAMKPTTQEGAAAMKSLLIMSGGAAAMFYLGNRLIGNSHEEAVQSVDPREVGRKFLSIKTPDGYYGVGGQFRSIAQMAAKTGEAMKTGRWDAFGTWDQNENPILNWYLGRGAPAVHLAQNTIEASTGLNANPYEEVNGPLKLASVTATDMLPFIVQAHLTGEDVKSMINGKNPFGPQDLRTAAADFNGIRTTQYTKAEETQQRLVSMGWQDLDGKPITDLKQLNKEQRDTFYQTYPVEKITKEDNVTKMFNLIGDEEDKFNTDLLSMSSNVSRGSMNKQQFKDWYKDRQTEKFNRIDQIKKDFSVLPADRAGFTGSVTDYINSRNTTLEDKAVNAYYDISSKMPLNNDGSVNYDGISKARQNLLSQLDPARRAYVERMTNKSQQTSENELVTEYDLIKKMAQPYWDAPTYVFDAFKNSGSGFFSQFSSYENYQNWIADQAKEIGVTPATMSAYIESKIKDAGKFSDVLSQYKKNMRLANPVLDRALTDWYGLEPANRLDYVLSGYGSDAGTAYAGSIARGYGPSRSSVTAYAMKLRNNPGAPNRLPRYSLN